MITHDPISRYSKWALKTFPRELSDLFDGFVIDPVAWVEGCRSVMLWGPEGTGKSCLMGSVHKYLASKQWLVYWVDCAAWPDDYEESDEQSKTLKNPQAKIVIWDDLGKEPANTRGDVRDTIFARHKMPTGVNLFTTNLNLSAERDKCELAEKYGPSLRSRLREMCGDYIIQYLGVDRRME